MKIELELIVVRETSPTTNRPKQNYRKARVWEIPCWCCTRYFKPLSSYQYGRPGRCSPTGSVVGRSHTCDAATLRVPQKGDKVFLNYRNNLTGKHLCCKIVGNRLIESEKHREISLSEFVSRVVETERNWCGKLLKENR